MCAVCVVGGGGGACVYLRGFFFSHAILFMVVR